MGDLTKAVGSYAERIKAIEEKVKGIEEGLKPPPLKVVISSGFSYGMATIYVAMANKFFEQEMPGLIVEPLYFVTGKEASDVLMAGRAHMSVSGLLPGVTAAVSAPERFAVVGPIADWTGSLMLVRPEIKAPSDLKGKRVGLRFGSDSYIWLLMFLEKHGLKLADINMVNMGPSDMPPAFSAGSVDALVSTGPSTWDPYFSEAQKLVPGSYDLTAAYKSPFKIFNVYTMSRDFMRAYPDAAAAVMRALIKASDWIPKNRDKAADIVVEVAKWKKEDVLTKLQPRYRFTPMISSDFITSMQATAKFMYDQGMVRNYVTTETFVDTSVMMKAAPQLVKPTVSDPALAG